MKPTKQSIQSELQVFNLSDSAIAAVFSLATRAYQRGGEQSERVPQFENKEKIGVEYAAEAFSECRDLSDFQDKQREINNRVCNFMTVIG